ncbi:MAG: hypothetical protein GY852_05610 [bacterium]|nr:hypothetical protein [bacterium]
MASTTEFSDYSGSRKRLLLEAVEVLKGNILDGEQYPWYPIRAICPSLDKEFRGVWNWDSAFHAVGVSRFDAVLAREQILLWLSLQLPSGELPDVLMENGDLEDTYGKPPVMPWAAMLIDRRNPDLEFTQKCYPAFVRLENHWRISRATAEGLFFYDSRALDPVQRETETRWESGWDNSPRWDNGIHNLYPVDLACFMVMFYEAMVYFAERLGATGDISEWKSRRLLLCRAVNTVLWNSGVDTWLDRDRFTGEFSGVLTPASFMPLFIGIASPEQAAASAELLTDSDIFFPGMPTVAYNHPEFNSRSYWRGRTWLNVAWFALKGFRRYGYLKETDSVRLAILEWCSKYYTTCSTRHN